MPHTNDARRTVKKRKPTQAEMMRMLKEAYLAGCKYAGSSDVWILEREIRLGPKSPTLKLFKNCVKYFGAVK